MPYPSPLDTYSQIYGTNAQYNLGQQQINSQNQQNYLQALVAQMTPQAALYGNQYRSDTDYNIAAGQDRGQTQRLGMQTGSNEAIARLQAEGELARARLAMQASNYGADQQFRQADVTSQRGLQGANYAADTGLKGQMYGYDTSRYNTQDNNRTSLEQARINANASTVPAYLQQERFKQVLPLLAQILQRQNSSKPYLGTMS